MLRAVAFGWVVLSMTAVFFLWLGLQMASGLLYAEEGSKIPEVAPSAEVAGKQCEWKSKDGLGYRYRIPANYDPEKGANLTFILHGSNLNRWWGFSNHSWKTFRPDDIVVSPDGTTPAENDRYNFLGNGKDAKRLRALQKEICETFKVNAVYLYGHSQGSFFAFYYAGLYPKDVNGIVGHASGTWKGTAVGKKGHAQAVVFMHGTQDPVVPYDQSVWGYRGYVHAKYPMIRLRSLENWNHWPAEHNGPVPHTSQQLAWCEGMTTKDPERLAACFAVLADNTKNRERHDYAALYTLSVRIASTPSSENIAPAELIPRAGKMKDAVQALAHAHIEKIQVPEKGKLVDGGVWIGHLPVFLRSFQGVPACEGLRTKLSKLLAKQEKDALKHMRKYWQARGKKNAAAFKAGVAALEKGYLTYFCWDSGFRKNLGEWRKTEKSSGLKPADVKKYDALIGPFEQAIKDGYAAFDAINKEHANLAP